MRELSLIAFPIRELFEIKLQEFDLIIFDNYQRRGVLPQFYLGNIANYVASGGALLEASGESFASAFSLFRTPLVEVLPGEPTGGVIEQAFRASVTEQGTRHPVTATLNGAPDGDEPDWGRWFRQVEVEPRSGTVVMEGALDRPLLILDRVGEGRVAQFASDHIWLWARNFEGGGTAQARTQGNISANHQVHTRKFKGCFSILGDNSPQVVAPLHLLGRLELLDIELDPLVIV